MTQNALGQTAGSGSGDANVPVTHLISSPEFEELLQTQAKKALNITPSNATVTESAAEAEEVYESNVTDPNKLASDPGAALPPPTVDLNQPKKVDQYTIWDAIASTGLLLQAQSETTKDLTSLLNVISSQASAAVNKITTQTDKIDQINESIKDTQTSNSWLGIVLGVVGVVVGVAIGAALGGVGGAIAGFAIGSALLLMTTVPIKGKTTMDWIGEGAVDLLAAMGMPKTTTNTMIVEAITQMAVGVVMGVAAGGATMIGTALAAGASTAATVTETAVELAANLAKSLAQDLVESGTEITEDTVETLAQNIAQQLAEQLGPEGLQNLSQDAIDQIAEAAGSAVAKELGEAVGEAVTKAVAKQLATAVAKAAATSAAKTGASSATSEATGTASDSESEALTDAAKVTEDISETASSELTEISAVSVESEGNVQEEMEALETGNIVEEGINNEESSSNPTSKKSEVAEVDNPGSVGGSKSSWMKVRGMLAFISAFNNAASANGKDGNAYTELCEASGMSSETASYVSMAISGALQGVSMIGGLAVGAPPGATSQLFGKLMRYMPMVGTAVQAGVEGATAYTNIHISQLYEELKPLQYELDQTEKQVQLNEDLTKPVMNMMQSNTDQLTNIVQSALSMLNEASAMVNKVFAG